MAYVCHRKSDIPQTLVYWQERPYHDDSTASRLLSEVKHRRAQLVLRWGTTLESWVLFFLLPAVLFVDLNTTGKTTQGMGIMAVAGCCRNDICILVIAHHLVLRGCNKGALTRRKKWFFILARGRLWWWCLPFVDFFGCIVLVHTNTYNSPYCW